MFWDSKRPITKKLLSRINVERMDFDPSAIIESARRIALEAGAPFDERRAHRALSPHAVPDAELTLF